MCDQYHAKRDASEASGFLMLRLASCCMSAKWVSIFVPFSAHALPHVGSIGTAAMRHYIPDRAHPPPVRRAPQHLRAVHPSYPGNRYLPLLPLYSRGEGITATPSLLVFIMQDIGNLRDRQFPTLFCDDNTWGIMVIVITGNADSTLHVIHPFYIVNIMLLPCSPWFRRSFVPTLYFQSRMVLSVSTLQRA